MNRPLILASTSIYRRELLSRLGLPFDVDAPIAEEESIREEDHPPAQLAIGRARLKAEDVATRHPDGVVIGSDQVCALGDRIFGKPKSVAVAEEQLAALSGRTHTIHTAVCVVAGGNSRTSCDTTRLRMRQLSATAITRYVATDQPLQCAGSFRLEARGIGLFESIDTNDHTAIIGLPLLAVTDALIELGFEIP